MKTVFNAVATFAIVFGVMLTIGVFLARWERPPMRAEQIGYRGTGMQQIINPRLTAQRAGVNAIPAPQDPAPTGGRPASEAYQNLQVLHDLTEDDVNRIMAAITEWVAPEQGCEYCHKLENLADDSVPAKLIARRMLQMTHYINSNWIKHVGQTGVTCYTCHRGKPVPAAIWFQEGRPGPSKGMAGYDAGQNHPARAAGLTALPNDPFSGAVDSPAELRVIGKTALRTQPGAPIKKTEDTYALMISISEALGVNCTFCHNSRSFFSWEQSVPARVPAFQGIQMVRDVNEHFLTPLKPLFADKNRLGPHGDVPKVNCVTCHRGVSKPLGGAQMAKDYPELGKAALEPVASMKPAPPPAAPASPPGTQQQ
jgi:photosynthetic reaction center cytochrome c subunit